MNRLEELEKKFLELGKEYKSLGEEISKMKSKPEIPYRTICEFWDGDRPKAPVMSRLHSILDGFYFHTSSDGGIGLGLGYDHCRPVPNIMEWIPWEGGEQPVDGDTVVTVQFRDVTFTTREAKDLYWSHRDQTYDVIAYVVVRPYEEEL